MKRQRNQPARANARSETTRTCDHPGCAEAGQFRAPRNRGLDSFYWFCLDHVRMYNAAWNFCAGMNEDDIERHVRADTIWRRPSWPFGVHGGARRGRARFRIDDAFGFLGDDGPAERVNGRNQPAFDAFTDGERRALALMELDGRVTWFELRARYMELVKRLHPDANGGDKAAEERLKLVNQAYATLKNSGAFA